MLSQKTCEDTWNCYREIKAGEKILADIAELNKDKHCDEFAEGLKDAFGRERNMHLGIPMGDSCRTMIDVSYDLAIPIIKAHIANKKARLVELNETALLEAKD